LPDDELQLLAIRKDEITMDSNRSSNNVLLWAAGGVLTLFLFGVMAALLVGVIMFSSMNRRASASAPVTAAPQTAINRPVAAAVQLPPRAVIATPEGGIDYENAALAEVYRQVNPSVVNISVFGDPHALLPDGKRPPGVDENDLFVISGGSGFVWDTDGRIITNNHVVEGAEQLNVTFSDGATAIATVIGTDEDSDLAVIKIDPDGYNLVPVKRGRIEDVYVGMRVIAIGNPFGLEGTMTSGIVSALGRSIPARRSFNIPGSIQTDAAINPGNSGGPLLNEQGELIGINAQIRSEVRSNSGVGFAIPISIVERVAPALIANGEYKHSYIGVSGQTFSPLCAEELGLSKDARGALILDVLGRTPASRAGLQGGDRKVDTQFPQLCPSQAGGDLVTAIDDYPVTKFDDVLTYLENFTQPGDEITLTVLRDGEMRKISITLAPRP
jgi:2-alkenal reductase